jgi:hypothetical protein
VPGAKVLLYSRPREATTDENGVAEFAGVGAGEHRVVVVYQGYRGERKVSLTGKTPEIDLKITIQPTTTGSSKRMIAVLAAGAAGLLLTGLFVWKLKASSRPVS